MALDGRLEAGRPSCRVIRWRLARDCNVGSWKAGFTLEREAIFMPPG